MLLLKDRFTTSEDSLKIKAFLKFLNFKALCCFRQWFSNFQWITWGICWKCRFLGPDPEVWIPWAWFVNPAICMFNQSASCFWWRWSGAQTLERQSLQPSALPSKPSIIRSSCFSQLGLPRPPTRIFFLSPSPTWPVLRPTRVGASWGHGRHLIDRIEPLQPLVWLTERLGCLAFWLMNKSERLWGE